MNLATVMYRNPAEEWLWESGFVSWFALIMLSAIGVFALACLIESAWRKWRNRK